jgi:hypothetical protein
VLEGEPQAAIATRESITQAAVSQNAHRSGAVALREALAALEARAGTA